MSLDKYFKMELGKDVTSQVKEIFVKETLNPEISFKEIILPNLNIKYTIPVDSNGEYFDNTFCSFKNKNELYSNCENQRGIIVDISNVNEKRDNMFFFYIDHNKKLDIKTINLTKGINHKDVPERSLIKICLEKKENKIIPSSEITVFRNCMDLFAKTNSSGKINKIENNYSEFAAWGADMFDSTKNPYQGIVVEHYKRKKAEKLGNVGEITCFGDIKLTETESKFVLANETGMKEGHKINYEKTMDNLLENKTTPWEKLIVFDK